VVMGAWPEEEHYWLTATPLPPLSAAELADGMERHGVAFVMAERLREYKSGPQSAQEEVTVDYSTHRMGSALAPVLADVPPVFSDRTAAVWDARSVVAALRNR